MPIRAFLDANAIFEAWIGREDISSRAMRLLYDPNRHFVGTTLLELETIGHAAFGGRQGEVSLQLPLTLKLHSS